MLVLGVKSLRTDTLKRGLRFLYGLLLGISSFQEKKISSHDVPLVDMVAQGQRKRALAASASTAKTGRE